MKHFVIVVFLIKFICLLSLQANDVYPSPHHAIYISDRCVAHGESVVLTARIKADDYSTSQFFVSFHLTNTTSAFSTDHHIGSALNRISTNSCEKNFTAVCTIPDYIPCGSYNIIAKIEVDDSNNNNNNFNYHASNGSITIVDPSNTSPTYQVTFNLGPYGTLTGGQLTQIVKSGSNAKPPKFTVDDGWTFAVWDGSYANVNSNRTITARYLPTSLNCRAQVDRE